MEWLDILRSQVAEKGSKTVAEEIGYAPSSVRLAVNGKYTAKTAKLAAKVLEVYCAEITCPFSGERRRKNMCALARKLDKAPDDNPQLHRYWQTCQKCLEKKGGKRNEN